MGLLPWEKTITCPYNAAHQITVAKIQTHLVKCRRNHPKEEFAICPFNASHHIPKMEEQFHTLCCPDRKIVELAKYTWAMETSGNHGRFDAEPPAPPAAPVPATGLSKSEIQKIMTRDENWETEAYIKESYNPTKKASSTQVIRQVQGATPSERKKFYASEKQRHELLKRNEEEKLKKCARAEAQKTTVAQSEDFFCSPRPSINISRPSEISTLRRPTIGESSVRGDSFIRHASVTSQLLALAGDRDKDKTRRLGSILMTRDASVNLDNTTDLDTSKDSNFTSTTIDPAEERMKQMTLNKPILRRPSGLGSFIKKS